MQDYKNWKISKKDVRNEKKQLRALRKSMTEVCDSETFSDNVAKTRMFAWVLRNNIGNKDFKDIINKCSQKYRASSCFYKIVFLFEAPLVRVPDSISSMVDVYKVKYRITSGVISCPNIQTDGGFDEERCADCAHFKDLIAYQMQKAQFDKAVENRANAKQKMLSHFWKQKVK